MTKILSLFLVSSILLHILWDTGSSLSASTMVDRVFERCETHYCPNIKRLLHCRFFAMRKQRKCKCEKDYVSFAGIARDAYARGNGRIHSRYGILKATSTSEHFAL